MKIVEPELDVGMKSGRELDALIAEKIMGWTDIESIKTLMEHGYEIYGKSPTSQPSPNTGYVPKFKVPRYSTDIAAAWEIVKKLRQINFDVKVGFSFNLESRTDSNWLCSISKTNGVNALINITDPSDDSAPYAICLAALKAIGHEII